MTPQVDVRNLSSMRHFGYRPLVSLTTDQQQELRTLRRNGETEDARSLLVDNMEITDDGFAILSRNNGLVVQSLLRKDEWEMLDAAVVEAAQTRLNVIETARQHGLIKPIGSLGVLVAQYNKVSAMTAASVSMSGRDQSDADRVDYNLAGVPIPVISKGFDIGVRELESARMGGIALDDAHVRAATRVVAEKMESIAIDGESSIVLNGAAVYGLSNFTDANTGSCSDFGTEGQAFSSFLAIKAELEAAGYYGPYAAWVYTTQYNQILAYHTDGSGELEVERILRIPEIKSVQPSSQLASEEVIAVQMTSDVWDVPVTMWPTLVEWSSQDGMTRHFKVMAVFTNRPKSDYDGNCGIAVYDSA